MKTTIDEAGVLCIKPESGLEAYALKKWAEDWNTRRSVLLVEVPHGTQPGATTVMAIDAPGAAA